MRPARERTEGEFSRVGPDGGGAEAARAGRVSRLVPTARSLKAQANRAYQQGERLLDDLWQEVKDTLAELGHVPWPRDGPDLAAADMPARRAVSRSAKRRKER
jgi:hypothetical protein